MDNNNMDDKVLVETESQPEQKPKGIKAIIEYIKTHENLRQMVMFLLFSMVCGAAQFTTTLVLPIILRAASPSMSDPFKWFMFDYTEKGIGEFIGFLVGSVIGQALTFILNRKKTFNIRDHVAFRAVAYAVMAVLIILMQTAIGGGVTNAFGRSFPDASDGLVAVFNLVAQVVAGFAALAVNFVGNKFFIMRKFKSVEEAEKRAAEQTEEREVE